MIRVKSFFDLINLFEIIVISLSLSLSFIESTFIIL